MTPEPPLGPLTEEIERLRHNDFDKATIQTASPTGDTYLVNVARGSQAGPWRTGSWRWWVYLDFRWRWYVTVLPPGSQRPMLREQYRRVDEALDRCQMIIVALNQGKEWPLRRRHPWFATRPR